METKTNDYKLIKFTTLVMLITIIALLLVWGTFAKYTSTASGTSAATVAKWDIKAGAQGEELSIIGDNATVAFNLFDTILEEDGNEEYDVIRDGSGNVIRIAPGTSGAFELSIVNDSEVTAAYTIDFSVEGAAVPLEFNVNDFDWTSSLDSVYETILEMSSSDIVNVQWRWPFDGPDDTVDTTLGILGDSITVTATLNVIQHDASEAPIVDFDAYAAMPTNQGNHYVSGLENDVNYISTTGNFFFNPGTTIKHLDNGDSYTIGVYKQDYKNPASAESVDEILYGSGNEVTIDDAGWYGITIFSDAMSLETNSIGDYVEFIYGDEGGADSSESEIDTDSYSELLLSLGNDYEEAANPDEWASINEDIYLTSGYTLTLNAEYAEGIVLNLYKLDEETSTYTKVAQTEVFNISSVTIDEDGLYGIALYNQATGDMTHVSLQTSTLGQYITFSI